MTGKTRILHIVGDSKFGGGAVIILRLAEMARLNGWEVDILTTDPTFQEAARSAGLGVIDLDVIWRDIRPLRDLLGLFRLYRFLRGSGYTIVHTHTSKAGVVGRLAAWLSRRSLIIHTVHGFAFHEESSPLELRCYAFLEKIAAYWCHRMVTVSEFHRQWSLELGIGDGRKVVAIPNGISEERVAATPSPEDRPRGEGERCLAILVAGRLAPQKGLEYLVDAIPRLQQRLSGPFRIIIAGDGPMREELEQRGAKLSVADRLLFLGFRTDIGSLLASCDLVVLPTLREGLSIALLEALAAGKPVITTTIGSNREVTRNGAGALLVPPKDSGALADAIITLANHPDHAARLAARGQEIFRAHYTEERMLAEYRSLYLRLLEPGARRNDR